MSEQRRRPARPHRSRPPQRRPGPRRPPTEDPARQAALDTVRAVRQRDAYANLVLPGLLRDRRITGRDAALATELAYGTCRAQGLLDAVLKACSDRPLNQIDGLLLDALRLGAYQLLRTRIPSHAAVASTVDLVRADLGSGAAGFANAVLRRVAEHDEPTWVRELAPDEATDRVGHLALAHAHPRWIVQAFADALGPARAELADALAADDARPAVHLAARPGAVSAEELAAMTGGEVAPYSPYAVHLEAGAGDPGDLEPVREGLAGVQDEGSQLAALALTRVELTGSDQRWLDLCAGPGGKAALLGSLVELNGGSLDAVEQAPHRADLVSKATRDLPVTVHVADGRDSGLPEGAFDRVLVDAPCTGLGSLRRRPESRWRRQPGDVAELAKLQRELLAAGLRLARPGGVVAYVVCSPHLPETLGIVADVLRRAKKSGPEIEQIDARPYFPDVPQLGDGPHVQLWPHRHGTDAMFCALFRRV
ncbi:RsmB/NOP family class I SAM-dependent RNA methyltransferase [Streptoalloteichus hindustanus]|uniref:16S rRNA (Cytosine967-C5)-methyltransferase n=1 Tax=Streptoalloteichus hindustanus TaxID=2017 RepID=A0A1M4XY07_STRHI|nr:RsmB/NOP family class I SAM-dependent RNA methyltransferase [Streptoalloteichus hindustanus]SHE98325.1 16S rRNA (cytosine967-C5)-methyltransferase [Streptoalloteichus hindustanus]